MNKLPPPTALKLQMFMYYFTAIFVLGFFPIYFEEIGFSKLQIGAIFAFGPMTGIVANVFWGLISDRFQIIKKLILFLVSMQFLLVLVLNQTDTYAIVMIIMLAMFFFQSSIIPLTDSLTLLTIKPLGHSFASYRIFGSIGFAVAALSVNPLLEWIGYTYTLILYAISLSLVIFSTTQLNERIGESNRTSFGGLIKLLKNKEILFILATIFLLAVAHRANDGFLTLYLKEIGMQNRVGLAWTLSALSEIPVFLLLSKYGDRFKELPLLALAAFFYCIRYLIVAFATKPEYVILAQLMHSVTFGIFYITAIRYISNIVPNQYRASGQALFAITFSGAAGIASGLLGGWIFEYGSGQLLYILASGCALFACCLFLLLQKKLRHSS